MNLQDAITIGKSIRRNCPFFQGYAMFGYNWRTFAICYPRACEVYRQCVEAGF